MAQAFYAVPPVEGDFARCKQTLGKQSYWCGSCKIWAGETDTRGYGVHSTTTQGIRIELRVQRLTYYLYRPPTSIAPSLYVLHVVCCTKKCINTDHLYEPVKINNKHKTCKESRRVMFGS